MKQTTTQSPCPYDYDLPIAAVCLLGWGAPAAAQATANPSLVGAGSSDALVMLLLLASFRAISWIARRLERRMQKQADFSSEHQSVL